MVDLETEQRIATGVRIELRVEHDTRVNYALQQNSVPVVHRVQVTNTGDERAVDLALSLYIDSELSEPWRETISRLDPGQTFTFETVDLQLNGETLRLQTERQSACLHARAVQSGAEVGALRKPIEVLAFNEWEGLTSIPESLAAFVLPNQPEIAGLLADTSRLLAEATGDASLSGYQRHDPAYVEHVLRALYSALQAQRIGYSNPPASFEGTGQKVRMPSEILKHRLGTCLDLSLLLAGCLEQAGFHPLIFLIQGHAFAGVWTTDTYFPEPAVDDAVRVRKFIALGEIIALEVTGIADGASQTSFDAAVKATSAHFEATEKFLYAVDVRAARAAFVRPLPIRTERIREGDAAPVSVPPARFSGSGRLLSAPTAQSSREAREEAALSTTTARMRRISPRVERWKTKLLDLSLRNKFVSYKVGRTAIPLQCPDVAHLEDELASGEAFQLQPKPEVMGADDPRSRELHKQRTGVDPVEEHLHAQLGRQILHSTLEKKELETRLLKAFREARLGLEESGANTMFLALGFLKWFETPSSDKPRLAPLLLFPIQLDRPSVRAGFRLRLADDDPLPNFTLLEKLKLDFPMIDVTGLDELPADHSGIDVPEILRRYQEAVRDVPRWEILTEAHISSFVFTKFLMWRDLEAHQDAVLRNKVVGHLVERPDHPFDPEAEFPKLDQLDAQTDPASTYCPRDADSSQLAAVIAGTQGRTFVLQGPPGTGKSQTITNLISNLLAHSKRVLFVSEKMAALNVVHHRLSEVGLAPFCLELHSRKANKSEVYAQLAESYQASSRKTPEEWETTANQLTQVRQELNTYTRALHRSRDLGWSAYQVQSKLTALRHTPRVRLASSVWERAGRPRLLELQELADRLQEAALAVGIAANHPFFGASCEQPPAGSETRLVEWSTDLLGVLQEYMGRLRQALEQAGLELLAQRLALASRDEIQRWSEALRVVARTSGAEPRLLTEPGWAELKPRLSLLVKRGQAAASQRKALINEFGGDLLELDLPGVMATLQYGLTAFFLWAWFFRWRARSAVRRVCPGKTVPAGQALLNVLSRARQLLQEERELAAERTGTDFLGSSWLDRSTDWGLLQRRLDWAGEFRSATRDLGTADEELSIQKALVQLGTSQRDRLTPGSPLHSLIAGAQESAGRHTHLLEEICSLLELQPDRVLDASAPYFASLEEQLRVWKTHAPRLRDWAHWRRTRADAHGAALSAVVAAYEDGRLLPDQVRSCFDRSFFEGWLEATVDADPVLATFHSREHERKVARFRELDKRHLELTKRCAVAKCAARVPPMSGARADSSASGILSRQLSLKKRQMPLRQLFKKVPELLFRLKPCMLMSPLSVAQYLDPEDFPNFDVVIFDEASQIPPWDAIGALARADSAIVVGDSKQMPPTSFFGRSDEGEETFDENDVQEVESILEECMASGLPTLHLNWHYRSKHEDLITFSNYHYYENRLHTFPAAGTSMPGLGVEFRHCADGVYDKGKSRTNRVEARAIVDELVKRLVSMLELPADKVESFGVVTFSQAQQNLVEDLIDEARREDPRLEPFFNEGEVREPVFVKNLENVQGDERDVILFSICYGPDQLGRVGVSFGPLNRDGGERRLNVAVTRARKQVMVFSSICADQIDLSRTRSVGVKHLKTFLDFAQRGVQAMAEATTSGIDDDFDSPLEQEICSALRAKGWDVDTQVGCSGYRIDLGVRDPEAPGRYLLGIECDGANYHSGKTARDRDRLRQAVLETLGWELHRIWSTDWWRDPKGQLEAAHAALLEAQVKKKAPKPEPARAPARASDAEGSKERLLFASQTLASSAEAEAPEVAPVSAPGEGQAAAQLPGQVVYKPLDPKALRPLGDDFYAPTTLSGLRQWISQIVEVEGPVSFKTVLDLVVGASELSKATKRVRTRVEQALASFPRQARPIQRGDFLWPVTLDPATYREFRVPELTAPSRKVEDIAPQELANVAAALLEAMISVSREDLAREVARVFGARLAKKAQAAIGQGLDELVRQGRAVAEGETLILPRL